MMKGTAYGVGVGTGDPELMTLKAVRIIRENDVIAVPGKSAKDSVAYRIAVQNVPELAGKTLLAINMPMTKDKNILSAEHKKGVELIEKYLDIGKNVVYLTLGDPTVYCSFSYLQRFLESDSYKVELVSGVTSFCAAAARSGVPLVEKDEELHVFPSVPSKSDFNNTIGTCVIMKSGRYMSDIKSTLEYSDCKVFAVENCGMSSEKIYNNIDEIPDKTGYFSIVIAKENE